jgi:NADH-ubiquinone oxidoreductase chain 6
MKNWLLDLLAVAAIFSGVLVITSKNPVISVIFLISVFINAAAYLVLLGLGFVGIAYIIVYVGAITVLFLFVIMMIHIKLTDILDVGTEYTKNLPLALAVAGLLAYGLFTIVPSSSTSVSILALPLNFLNYFNESILSSDISSVTIINNNISPANADISFFNLLQIESLGHALYTYGALWLIVTSFILLLAMLAPILLTYKPKVNN